MSYVSQQSLVFDNSTLANFKSWAQAISTAFSSAAWTQTTDTGQVNWSTIAVVPTSGNFVYEIWQPSDALQTGGTKFYVKIKYGTSSGSPAGGRIQVQLGTSTDGAGNPTGFTTTANLEITVSSGIGQGSTVADCYFSADTNRFAMMMWRSFAGVVTSCPCGINIERTHNTDGTDSSDGVTCLTWSNDNHNMGQETIAFGIGMKSNVANPRAYITAFNNVNGSGAFNNEIPVSPTFPEYGVIGNPMTGIAFVHTQDVAESCFFNTTLYGATRTYIATGNFSSAYPGTSARLCMRFD